MESLLCVLVEAFLALELRLADKQSLKLCKQKAENFASGSLGVIASCVTSISSLIHPCILAERLCILDTIYWTLTQAYPVAFWRTLSSMKGIAIVCLKVHSFILSKQPLQGGREHGNTREL